MIDEILQDKPGIRTTEFWLHAMTAVIGVLAGLHVLPNGLPQKYSWIIQLAAFGMAGLAALAYGISRGLAKRGHLSARALIASALGNLERIDPTSAGQYVEGLLGMLPLNVLPTDARNRIEESIANIQRELTEHAAAIHEVEKLATGAPPVVAPTVVPRT